MKVALVIERMDERLGGKEVYTARIARALAQRGHAVTVVCQQAASAGLQAADGVEIIELGGAGLSKRGRLARFVQAAGQRTRGQFDIVHAMLPLPGATIYQPHGGTIPGARTGRLASLTGARRILSNMGTAINPMRRLMARLERQVLADQRTCCLCVSDKVSRELAEHYGRRDNVRVIFNGVTMPPADDARRSQWRTQQRAQLGAGDGEALVLTVANNFRLKGVAQTIEAFAAWQSQPNRRPARLVAVGQRDVSPYRRLARRLGVGEKVTFLPSCPDLLPWYAAADAVALLTWYDSCSLVLLEALCWGIPAVTTQCAGAACLVAQGGGAVLDSPREVARAARAMEELTSAAALARVQANCAAIAPGLGLYRHVDELAALYKELAAHD